MYSEIKKLAASTKGGTYRRPRSEADCEQLPWNQWFEMDATTKEQDLLFKRMYPILLQEINSAKPSRLHHYLIGKSVLFWQDVIVIEFSRKTDMEMNSPLLRILQTRGRRGFKGLVDGLRSRHGAWQGYLAFLLENKCCLSTIKDLLGIYKIISHDIVRVMPVGWMALPRALGLPASDIETCRRENKIMSNQVLHSLLMWTGQRKDKGTLLSQILAALRTLNRSDIADGIVTLVQSLPPRLNKRRISYLDDDSNHEDNSAPDLSRPDSVFETELPDVTEDTKPDGGDGRKTTPRARTSKASTSSIYSASGRANEIRRVKSGKLYGYNMSPRNVTNVWEKRKPSVTQLDYMVHPTQDNLFMDYLVYQ